MSIKTGAIDSYQPQLPAWGVLVESHHHEPNFKTGVHLHSYSSLVYVVSGMGRCVVDGVKYELESDSVLMLRRNASHQMVDKPGKAMVVFVVYFADNLPLVDNEMVCSLFKAPFIQAPRHNSRQFRLLLRQMLYEQNAKPKFYDTALLQCFSSIMLMLFRLIAAGGNQPKDKPKSTDRVSEALKYVQSHYYETFALSDISADAGLSERQFTNICRDLKGQSFVQYLNSIRTQKAKQLLLNSSMSVSAIAFEVGFEELSTFYRAFNKHQGKSPLSFRKDKENEPLVF